MRPPTGLIGAHAPEPAERAQGTYKSCGRRSDHLVEEAGGMPSTRRASAAVNTAHRCEPQRRTSPQ